MRTTTRLAGVAAASAAMMAIASPAFADSAENDGINAANDNNIQANVPVCGNDISAVAVPLSLLSPEMASCTTGDVNDHSS